MEPARIYDIAYALAARDGREAALFGSCAPAAREAFSRSLVGEGFPELWFEIPLLGEPWMDFHALVSHKDVAGARASFAGHDGVYADALAWFADQEPDKVRQLALSYDTSAGDVDTPAVQLLVNGPNPSVPIDFLDVVARPDLRDSYSEFVRSMPHAWYACYVGVFPGRNSTGASPWVRVECIVGDECQRAYAKDDASTLQGHLKQVGLDGILDDAIPGIQELARTPFPLELQFNVGPAGAALPAVSASVRFQPSDWVDASRQAQIGRLARWLQTRGLADERCALLAQTVFAKRLGHGSESVLASCFPAFVKLRWREGIPPDAKAYLMVQLQFNYG